MRRFRTPHTFHPQAHFLSNGRYTAIVTNGGGGASVCGGRTVTRWHEDRTRDLGSQFVYLRDLRSGLVWSATYQPTRREAEEYVATFHLDRAVFCRRDDGIATQLEIAVSPEDDVEVRRIRLVNDTDRLREIEVTSYVELALGSISEDPPVQGKLFLETEYLPGSAALLCRRRAREPSEPEICAMHVLSVETHLQRPLEWETDRAKFLGRRREPDDPLAMEGGALVGSTGSVPDRIASLRLRVLLAPGGSARLAFATGLAQDRAAAAALAGKYGDPTVAARAFALAQTHVQTECRHLGITPQEAQLYLRLASATFFTDWSLRPPADLIARNELGRPTLRAHGISGDLPIVLVLLGGDDLPLLRQVLKAQEYWRLKGLAADVVILSEHPVGESDGVHDQVQALLESGTWAGWKGRAGGVHLLRGDRIADSERVLLIAAAQAFLRGERGELASQLEGVRNEPKLPARLVPSRPPQEDPEPMVPAPERSFENGVGGFSENGREYAIVLEGDRRPPRPWVNILANPRFGTIVTSSGASFTWSENSRENRLTPFANDPLIDPTAEAIYLRDEEVGTFWSATPNPTEGPRGRRWVVTHGAGLSRFRSSTAGISHELRVLVHPTDPVKYSVLTLINHTERRRRLGVFAYAEWALGPPQPRSHLHVSTEPALALRAVFARNPFNQDFAGRVAFAALSETPVSATGDRLEFVGRNGTLARPAALGRQTLGGRFGTGLDPCVALHSVVEIPPLGSRSLVVVLGQGRDETEARELVRRAAGLGDAEQALDLVRRRWDDLLETIQVRTPDDSFDQIMNRWLLYQVVSSRLWGRTGYHEAGGSLGFRDQLQNVAALLVADPDLAREHIVRAASRRFPEGDVQHRGLPESGRPIRTRSSDDLLWLPYLASRYVEVSGRSDLLDLEAPFLEGPPPLSGTSRESASIYEHCARAIDRGLTAGSHGLPLIDTGDWNDGMHRVGRLGRGESVGLGWFLSAILRRFSPIARSRGDDARAARYERETERLAGALDLAWDGDWYRRACHDDGTPLGSSERDECKIDGVIQAWIAMAIARQGNGDEAVALFHMLNPIDRTRTLQEIERYEVEPYSVAADICSHSGHVGRTRYTGSAGWLYRLGLEEILGFDLRGKVFAVRPTIPASWPGFTLRWRAGETLYEIIVENSEPPHRDVLEATLDGVRVDPRAVPIVDDRRVHVCRVVLGRPPEAHSAAQGVAPRAPA